MSNTKANASEPLMTCRKRKDYIKTGSVELFRDEFGGSLFTDRAVYGMKEARAYYRLLYGTREPVVLMIREKFKWKTHENESTDARHRGGLTHSSDEVAVMAMERRGWIAQCYSERQPAMGGTDD